MQKSFRVCENQNFQVEKMQKVSPRTKKHAHRAPTPISGPQKLLPGTLHVKFHMHNDHTICHVVHSYLQVTFKQLLMAQSNLVALECTWLFTCAVSMSVLGWTIEVCLKAKINSSFLLHCHNSYGWSDPAPMTAPLAIQLNETKLHALHLT
jgi:hypothetical protein